MRTPNGIPIYPGDAADWGFEDGVLTSPTCAAERGMELAMRCARAQLNRDKAEIERKYERRLEKIEEKLTMEGVKDITAASSIGDVKLVEAQMKAKLTGKTVPTALCALFALALSVFGATNEVHYANVNDLTDGKVVTNVVFGDSGVDTNKVKALAGSVTSNVVTKSYVEGLGLETVVMPVTVTNISSAVASNVVTRKYVEDLHIAPPGGISPEDATNIAGRVTSNVVTKTYVEGLGISADVDWVGVTNASAKVTSNVVTKAYVEGLGVAVETDWQGVTNVSAKVTSNVVTKAYVESLGIAPPGGVSPSDATNIAGRVTSNVVTKTYVEGLGISADVDWERVGNVASNAAVEATKGKPSIHINRTIDEGLKVADVTVNGERRDIYIPPEFPAVTSKGSSADIARRSSGSSVLRSSTSLSGSQSYVTLAPWSFLWLPNFDEIWVGGEVDPNTGIVHGAMRVNRFVEDLIAKNAPPPHDYETVYEKAMGAVQSLQPAYDYTDGQAPLIRDSVIGSVTNKIAEIVSNTVIDKAEMLVSHDGSSVIDAYGNVSTNWLVDSVLGEIVVTRLSDGSDTGIRLKPVGTVDGAANADGPFYGTYESVKFWESDEIEADNGPYVARFVYRAKFITSRRFTAGGAVVSVSRSWLVSANGWNYRKSTGAVDGIINRDVTVETDEADPMSVSPVAGVFGYPGNFTCSLTRDIKETYSGPQKTGRLLVSNVGITTSSFVTGTDDAYSLSPNTLYTNAVDNLRGVMDVFVSGRRLPGRMVPDMVGRDPNGPWYWKYEGGDTPAEGNIVSLVYTGGYYDLTCTNEHAGVYATWHCDRGNLPLTVSSPHEGLELMSVFTAPVDDEPISGILGGMDKSCYTFVCHAVPYVYRVPIKGVAFREDIAAEGVRSLRDGDRVLDADMNVYSITNRGEDYFMFNGIRYDRVNIDTWMAISASYSIIGHEFTNSVNASKIFHRINNSGSDYLSWLYIPNGTDVRPQDEYRQATVSSFREGYDGNYDMAETIKIPMPHIVTPTVTASTDVAAFRYFEKTNYVDRAVRESSLRVTSLLSETDPDVALKADASIVRYGYSFPYEGDTVYVDGEPFVYDPVRSSEYLAWGYYRGDYYFTSSVHTNYDVNMFVTYNGGAAKTGINNSSVKLRRNGTSSAEVAISEKADIFGGDAPDMLSGTVNFYPFDPESTDFGTRRLTRTIMKSPALVDRAVMLGSFPSTALTSGIACTNTSSGAVGVIRPSYDGTAVHWTWSVK